MTWAKVGENAPTGPACSISSQTSASVHRSSRFPWQNVRERAAKRCRAYKIDCGLLVAVILRTRHFGMRQVRGALAVFDSAGNALSVVHDSSSTSPTLPVILSLVRYLPPLPDRKQGYPQFIPFPQVSCRLCGEAGTSWNTGLSRHSESGRRQLLSKALLSRPWTRSDSRLVYP